MQRQTLLPDFYDSPYEGWAVNYLDRNFWRFQKTIGSFEDALAESALVFYECRRLYGQKAQNSAHFMSLYKRMMYSWFTDWATYDSRERDTIEASAVLLEPSVMPEGWLVVLLREASAELNLVLDFLLNAPKNILGSLRRDVQEGLDVFFRHVVEFVGLPGAAAQGLEDELRTLLS